MVENIIFDFDGTIVDTLDLVINIYNKIAKKKKLRMVNLDDIDLYKNMSPLEILRNLKISIWKLPTIANQILKDMRNSIKNVDIINGIDGVIQELCSSGFNLYIVTSNSIDNVNYILKKYNIDLFKKIYHASILNKDKTLQRVVKENRLDKNKTIYIGDEYRDVVACKKIDIPIISVLWGYSGIEKLKSEQPQYIVSYPQEILDIIK